MIIINLVINTLTIIIIIFTKMFIFAIIVININIIIMTKFISTTRPVKLFVDVNKYRQALTQEGVCSYKYHIPVNPAGANLALS